MDKSYCLVCLCSSSDYDIHDYKIQCENFWALFEVSNIKLCFLCKRIAQHAEIFIQNVKSNQLLLQNCFGDLDTTIQEVIQARSSQLQTSVTLSQTSLESITLAEKDIIDVGSTCIEVKMRKPLAGNKDVIQTSDENALHEVDVSDKNTMMIQKNIKIELKEEVLDHSDGGFDYINEEFITPHIKEEDDFPLNVFQEELTVEAIKVKPLKPVGKNKTIKKEVEKVKNTQVDKELGIKKIFITKEECMEERKQQALDQVYINCTYKCVDCLKGFNYKAGYENHLKKHSEEIGEYMCDICKMRMESHEKMLEHKKYHRIRFQCIECGLVRISRSTVVDHYNAMHKKGESQFVCPYCLKSFKRQMSQRKHIRYTHQKKGRVMCAYCQKSYANKAVLKSHMMMQHSKEVAAVRPPKKYSCPDCGKLFRSPADLRIHSYKHSLTRDYYCVECDKAFKSEAVLKKHLKLAQPHAQYSDMPFSCEHCEKRFVAKGDIERHIHTVHFKIKPFKCDKCDKAYACSKSLAYHTKRIHEGYKRPLRHPCRFCDKIFDSSTILKVHIRTHTGERPYQCDKCPAQFSQSGVLATHNKLVHQRLTRDGRPKQSAPLKDM